MSHNETRHRILIVDDSAAIHGDFLKILGDDPVSDQLAREEAEIFGSDEPSTARAAFDLDFAFQGEEALEKTRNALAEGKQYAVVFMDVRMPPGWDGIETSVRLWEIDADLQIVICTAFSDYSWEAVVARLVRSDQFLILKKSFDPIEAIQCAHALCAKWEQTRRIRDHADHLEKTVVERTAELVEMRDAALESANAMSRFLANMSHEIRTPMNGVIGMAELLSHTSLEDTQRDYVDTIRHSADVLLDIINDILDSAKIESGKFVCETVDLDLRVVVETTLDTLASSAQQKEIELAGHVEPGVFPLLRGDPGRLRQILTNLVGNAIKFTSEGDVSVIARHVRESESHAVIRFSVRDTGIGIAPDDIGKIFDPFAQADSSDTRRHGGTGLGLTICRQLVEAMGGTIGVESEVSSGSTFWFELTLEKQVNPIRTDDTAIPLHSGIRVLVTDDNPTNRDILMQQLSNLGMLPATAAGGAEALGLLQSAAAGGEPFEIAIIDMQMPEMDGITLAKAIRTDPAVAAVRVILLSSLGDHLTNSALRDAGIENYLVKPIKQTRLRDLLAAMLNHPSQPVSETPSSAAPEHLRILLAEDNEINRKVALLQLERLGYQADVVTNGAEVLDALRTKTYDVILMDCQMPVMDGHAATREIRSDPSPPCPHHRHHRERHGGGEETMRGGRHGRVSLQAGRSGSSPENSRRRDSLPACRDPADRTRRSRPAFRRG